jgi:hypothetical protein
MGRAWCFVLLMAAMGCKQEAPSPAPGAPAAAPAAPADAAQAAAPAAPAPAPVPAVRTLRGTFTGRGVDAPLRAFDPTMAVDPWQGEGALTLELPREDGAVTGTMRATGMAFVVRGWRAGDTVRATLEPEAAGDAGSADVWRGLLDARLAGDALTGTWRASAEAGRRTRGGTVTAR